MVTKHARCPNHQPRGRQHAQWKDKSSLGRESCFIFWGGRRKAYVQEDMRSGFLFLIKLKIVIAKWRQDENFGIWNQKSRETMWSLQKQARQKIFSNGHDRRLGQTKTMVLPSGFLPNTSPTNPESWTSVLSAWCQRHGVSAVSVLGWAPCVLRTANILYTSPPYSSAPVSLRALSLPKTIHTRCFHGRHGQGGETWHTVQAMPDVCATFAELRSGWKVSQGLPPIMTWEY